MEILRLMNFSRIDTQPWKIKNKRTFNLNIFNKLEAVRRRFNMTMQIMAALSFLTPICSNIIRREAV